MPYNLHKVLRDLTKSTNKKKENKLYLSDVNSIWNISKKYYSQARATLGLASRMLYNFHLFEFCVLNLIQYNGKCVCNMCHCTLIGLEEGGRRRKATI